MRWYNTVLSHPNISEFTGPLIPPPINSSASSSTQGQQGKLKGTPNGQQTQAHGAPNGQQSQAKGAPNGQEGQAKGSSDGHQGQANGAPNGRPDKPKGKDAKGGKLAKNDVAKGQKKGGDKAPKAPTGGLAGHPNTPSFFPNTALSVRYSVSFSVCLSACLPSRQPYLSVCLGVWVCESGSVCDAFRPFNFEALPLDTCTAVCATTSWANALNRCCLTPASIHRLRLQNNALSYA